MTYSYNELGERTKTEPSTGPATTYGYDQAGNLTSVERPEEGKPSRSKTLTPTTANGLRSFTDDLRHNQLLAWDTAEELPLLLNDGTNSYIYGPGGLPVEQISSGGTVTYLHHDQQGSTRLLTGSTASSRANAPTPPTAHHQRRARPLHRSATTANTPAATRDSSTYGRASTIQPRHSSSASTRLYGSREPYTRMPKITLSTALI